MGDFRTLLLDAACIGRKFGVVAKPSTSKKPGFSTLLFFYVFNLIILVTTVLNVSTRRFYNWSTCLFGYF